MTARLVTLGLCVCLALMIWLHGLERGAALWIVAGASGWAAGIVFDLIRGRR